MKICRTIAALLAVLFLIACTPADPPEANAVTAEDTVLTNIFTASRIPIATDYDLHPHIVPYYDEENGTVTWVGSQTERIPTPDGFESETAYFVITSDQNGAIVYASPVTTDLSGRLFLEGGVLDGRILTAGICLRDGESSSYHIMRYDTADGTAEFSPAINHLFSDYVYIDTLLTSEDKICLFTDTELLLLDHNYELLCKIQFVFPPDALCLSPDGVFHVLADNGQGQLLYPVDPERKSLGTGISLSGSTVKNALFSSDGTLYYTDESGLHAYTGDGSVEIMNFEHSGVVLFHLNIYSIIDGTRFFAAENGYTDPSFHFAVFSKSGDIDLSSVRVLELAAASATYELTEQVNDFNRTHPGIRVHITDYSAYNTAENPSAGKEKLLFDISVGNTRPDIVYAHWDADVMRYLLRDGLYLDLYAFIDKDADFSRDDFLGAYLSAYEKDGKLWGMTPYLTVSTLVGTADSLGGMTSWSAEDMISFALSLPEEVSFTDHMSLHDLEEMILGDSGYGMFIENGAFNSAAYQSWLELIENLPAHRPDEPTSDAEIEAMRYSEFLARRDGQTAVTPYTIYSPEDWFGIRALFDSADTVLIGYPSENGSRASVSAGPSFLITSFTDDPETAWELVKACCLPAKGQNRTFTQNLPLLKSDLTAEAERIIGRTVISYYSGSNTTREYNPYDPVTEEDLNKPGVFGIFTEEDAADLLGYLDSKTGIPLTEQLPEEIDAVFREEISAFRDGVYTAEECAQRTQSRAEIWLAEHE